MGTPPPAGRALRGMRGRKWEGEMGRCVWGGPGRIIQRPARARQLAPQGGRQTDWLTSGMGRGRKATHPDPGKTQGRAHGTQVRRWDPPGTPQKEGAGSKNRGRTELGERRKGGRAGPGSAPPPADPLPPSSGSSPNDLSLPHLTLSRQASHTCLIASQTSAWGRGGVRRCLGPAMRKGLSR